MQKVIVLGLACAVLSTAVADPLRPAGAGPAPHRPPIAERVRGDIAIVPTPPRPAPPVPHPYPETATIGKQTAGTWTCTGAVANVTIKLALDNAWIQWTIVGAAGTTVQYRTYDGIAKQWTMLELTSSGKSRTLTSLGLEKDGWTWTLDDHRELESFTKDTLALSGERRHGTSWAKNYEASCKRH